ncbi:MAG: thioredoxin [Chloroflexi bacterium]|nr:thioredoxin [Chloroflexota bacterium]
MPADTDTHVSIVNQSEWESEVLSSETPVLVYFWAEWCPPCKMLGPIVKEIAEEQSQLRVVKVDADDNPDIVMQYGIMGIPTLLLIKNGEVAERVVGFRPKDKILDSLTGYI